MPGATLRTLLVAAALAAPGPLRADSVPERHHVIVVIDRSGSMVDGGAAQWTTLERTITTRLRDACFTPGWGLPGRPLLDPASGDVLSIVSFGLERDARDFSGFIQMEREGVRYGMVRRTDSPRDVFEGLWRTIESFGPGGFFSGHLSGISLALPLALEYEGRHGAPADRPVHRTFVLLVTDDRYNGPGTVNLELEELARTPVGGAVDEVRRRVDDVYEQYGFAQRRTDDGTIRLKLFEVVPRRSFDIGALWSFNNEAFDFHRVDGGFRSDFRLHRRPDAPATLQTQRIEALLVDGGVVIARRTLRAGREAPGIEFTLPAGARPDSLSVRLRFWVRQADGVYGMLLYDPDGPDAAERAALGVTIPVRLEPAGLILGVIPVGPWSERLAAWMGVHGQAAVVRLWNLVILAAAVIAAVVAVFSWALRASTITSGRALVNGRMGGAR